MHGGEIMSPSANFLLKQGKRDKNMEDAWSLNQHSSTKIFMKAVNKKNVVKCRINQVYKQEFGASS
jgi:hypothetical protein